MSDRLSRLYPSRYIMPKVPTSESGTATLGITVARTVRRKANTTRMTRMMEMTRVNSVSCTDARMVTVRSSARSSLMEGGIEACNCGSRLRTRSTVAMMFAPGWRKMIISTASLACGTPALRPPSTDAIPILRRSSTESCTSATSPRRTTAPFLEETISSRY